MRPALTVSTRLQKAVVVEQEVQERRRRVEVDVANHGFRCVIP